jgi:hypothetical protein
MTSAHRPWLTAGFACLSAFCGWPGAAGAQAGTPGLELIKGGSTPAAIHGIQILNSRYCPLVVKPSDAAVQPLWIPPSQVKAKNSLGCLSGADAIYGADGCPTKLCGAGTGVIPMPADMAPAASQLPDP